MKPQTPPPKRPPLDQAPLRSLRELEFLLGVERGVLRRLADEWRENYAPFQQAKSPKPHTKATEAPKLRHIDNPCKELKRVQTKILDRLLLSVALPNFLFGAVRKRCVRSHARQHLGATTIVKMDIKSYYPNVTSRHVRKVWRDVLHCSPRVADLLTQLTTCEWRLPQGAPTSPALANLFLASIYAPVLEACVHKNIVVTAWVDDLTFSGKEAREVIELVRKTLAANGLKDSRKKRKILNSQTSKVVTGVRLGRDKIRACKLKLRDIRAGIHNLKVGRVTPRGRARDIESLRAQIIYVKSLCPADAAPLESQLKQLVAGSSHLTPECTVEKNRPTLRPDR
jgi:RNA-directed DNA polymerase